MIFRLIATVDPQNRAELRVYFAGKMHSTCNPNAAATLCFKGMNPLGVKFKSGCLAYIAHLRQQRYKSKFVIFSGETFKGFEVL